MVTPEAVVLDVRTAGLGSRALARTLDGLIQIVALGAVSTIVSALSTSAAGSGGPGTIGVVIILVGGTAIVFAYPILFEWLWKGRTPGKAALGLRVVTLQGAPIHFRHALVRGLIGIGELTPPLLVIGVVTMLASSKDQRLGDMAAGTIVIRERTPARRTAPVAFYPPPGWESFVDSLDVSAMTAGEYETVRSFLLRVSELTPVARSSLAAQLASPLVIRWHQPVPSGAGPELWLACVVAAYQRRHSPPVGPYGYGAAGYGPAGYGPAAYGPGAWAAPNPGSQVAGPWAPPAPGAVPDPGAAPMPPGPPAWGPPGSPAPPVWGPPPLGPSAPTGAAPALPANGHPPLPPAPAPPPPAANPVPAKGGFAPPD